MSIYTWRTKQNKTPSTEIELVTVIVVLCVGEVLWWWSLRTKINKCYYGYCSLSLSLSPSLSLFLSLSIQYVPPSHPLPPPPILANLPVIKRGTGTGQKS